MNDDPASTIERPKRRTRRRIAAILCIVAVPAVWIGYELLDDDGCGCAIPDVGPQNAVTEWVRPPRLGRDGIGLTHSSRLQSQADLVGHQAA